MKTLEGRDASDQKFFELEVFCRHKSRTPHSDVQLQSLHALFVVAGLVGLAYFNWCVAMQQAYCFSYLVGRDGDFEERQFDWLLSPFDVALNWSLLGPDPSPWVALVRSRAIERGYTSFLIETAFLDAEGRSYGGGPSHVAALGPVCRKHGVRVNECIHRGELQMVQQPVALL